MSFIIKPMSPIHYDEVYSLWNSIEGMDLDPLDDNLDSIRRFLAMNPGLNYVATVKNKIVGVIMCGFDGRRATIYHAAVAPNHRNQGIGRALLDKLESMLRAKGITKGRLLAFKSNQCATLFWQQAGWHLQEQLNYFSKQFVTE